MNLTAQTTAPTVSAPVRSSRGAGGDELVTALVQQAIDDAALRGGGRVVVPPGVHRTGALRLRSGIDLHLEAGALLQFVPDPALYPPVTARWEGVLDEVHSPCLYAQGEQDVSVTGLGTVDGGGQSWWELFRERPEELAFPRPTLIGLHECERVTLRDVRLRNSPAWTVHPALCDGVVIDGLRIENPEDSPNTDGIDPESCRGVRISNCHIDVGDDCIAVKAGTEHTAQRVACENVVISNCTMVHGHGGVVLGSEMSGSVRNVVISTCVFQSTDRGIRMKTRRGRGGLVENVRVSNVVMDDVLCPLTVNPFYFCGPGGKAPHVGDRSSRAVDGGTPWIRGLHLAHVTATRVRAGAAHVFGLPEAPISDLTLDDVAVTFAADPDPGIVEMADGLEPVTRQGIQLGHVHGARLRGLRVRGVDGEALTITDCQDVVTEAGT